ncbi:hypothetical protein LAZ67_20002018 [Cordylochernes scorpioides]|uniref:Gag protein n=1 Tax=Cordylochernes scorpioides TaxID=51811 RepID=A0ABY6LKT3_9ARAC|nr:hypothetical protein LAZ67_20002018 [Cordylochernes scorpioides]
MAQIQPPETFDFSTPNEWPKWRKRFERYLVVSGMKKKEEADKIDLFMYLMGDRADDIFRTFKFEKEEEATKIDSVLKAFDSHFCVRKNIIYERAKFNSRIQEDREPVDEFITSLYKLADSCEFEGLHEQLIRDRIVVGVRDKALSERMQLDSELTLEKAVKMVRQQESVRQQQVDLQRPSTSQKVNQVKFNSKKQSPKQQQQPSRKKEKSAKTRSRCPKCGGFTHRRKDMKSRYDRRCGATDMEELSEGDTVWITDMRTWGIVKKKASTPRSYMVDTPVGTLRRNRFHLRKGYAVQYPADPSTPTISGEELVENEKTPVVDFPSNDSEDGQIRTRIGRRTKRWPLCLFFNFLDVVAINSAVIYKAVKQDGGMARKDFIKQLALQLMRDALNMRNQAKYLSRDLQVLIQKHAGTSSLEKQGCLKCRLNKAVTSAVR